MENQLSKVLSEKRMRKPACRVDTDDSSLYTLFNLPRISQVYLFFRASLKLPNFSPGLESLDVQLFDEEQIPWEEIAFPVVRATLKHYFEDRKNPQFPGTDV